MGRRDKDSKDRTVPHKLGQLTGMRVGIKVPAVYQLSKSDLKSSKQTIFTKYFTHVCMCMRLCCFNSLCTCLSCVF